MPAGSAINTVTKFDQLSKFTYELSFFYSEEMFRICEFSRLLLGVKEEMHVHDTHRVLSNDSNS